MKKKPSALANHPAIKAMQQQKLLVFMVLVIFLYMVNVAYRPFAVVRRPREPSHTDDVEEQAFANGNENNSFDEDDDSESSSNESGGGEEEKAAARFGVPAPPETFVRASSCTNAGSLKKPLKVTDEGAVTCPEQGGKNLQCSKVYAEFTFSKLQPKTSYFLYVQTIAPTIMDNSLWISPPLAPPSSSSSSASVVGNLEAFTAASACKSPSSSGKYPLVPHKHTSGSSARWLCCPAYLAKNKKKNMAPFYSDCCHPALGPGGDETGCVLDLEVSTGPQWNEFPRAFRLEKGDSFSVRIYFREDGTAVSGVFLSSRANLATIPSPSRRRRLR